MFIDFLTMVMINMVAGTFLLAYYLWKGMDDADQRPYAAAFFGVGLLSLVAGLQLSFTWPLPGSYNVAYGDTTTLFGIVFLGTAIALWQGWNLAPVAMYAFFAGIDAVIVGVRILSLGLTKEPLVSAVGFLLSGIGGLGAAPFLMWFKSSKGMRMLGALLMLATAVLWAIAFYNALWGHMDSFSKWVPPTMGTGG